VVVAFAINLARTDLADCRPWELERLRDELAVALGRSTTSCVDARAGHLVKWSFDGSGPDDFNIEDFEPLQRDVLVVLRMVCLPKKQRAGAEIKLGPTQLTVMPYLDRSALLVEGSVRNAFMFLLASALTQVPNKLVGRCPECDRLFLATGKRRYCDRTCTNKASMKKWTAKRLAQRAAAK
jgi:hypothetical protein